MRNRSHNRLPLSATLRAVVLALLAATSHAGDVTEIDDPAAIAEFAPPVFGSKNALFSGAMLDARMNGMTRRLQRRLRAVGPTSASASATSVTGQRVAQQDVCSVTAPSTAKEVLNICLLNGVVIERSAR